MSAGIKANNDGSAAIQVGGSDFIQISATGNVTIPQSQTVSGSLTVTGAATSAGGQIRSGTAVASTSGTSIDFTGIPSWVKRITVMFNGVSTNGSSPVQVQIGSGSVTTSGYVNSSVSLLAAANGIGSNTAGFQLETGSGTITSATVRHGGVTLALQTGNTWVAFGVVTHTGTTSAGLTGGFLTLSGTLDRVRITTVSGADTFDAGSINILYEG